MSRQHVVLVPGFFGFGSLGALSYFVGVREALARAFETLSLDVNIVEVPTLPTASIRHRAARVQETLTAVADAADGPIHIVGHSTGGLDARLAIAPTASLPTACKFRAHARLRTLLTLSTPHFGTPLASFFGSAAGSPLLRSLSWLLVSGLKHGRMPLRLGLRVGGWITRADATLGFQPTVVDDFFREVIGDFSPERRAELIAFIEGVAQDQSLIFQLTPAGCDLLNASTADPDSLRYGSIVCRGRRPHATDLLTLTRDPYTRSMHVLYALLHRVAGFARSAGLPEPVPEQRRVLERAFGKFPRPSWSDGIVPTLSQVWGEVIYATDADHLDVVGHYGSLRPGQIASDWLPSGSGFDDAAFDALWGAVAGFIAEEARRHDVPRHRRNVGVERTEIEPRDLAPGEDVSAPESSRRKESISGPERARQALRGVRALSPRASGEEPAPLGGPAAPTFPRAVRSRRR
jgi:triacylglycerol lipase